MLKRTFTALASLFMLTAFSACYFLPDDGAGNTKGQSKPASPANQADSGDSGKSQEKGGKSPDSDTTPGASQSLEGPVLSTSKPGSKRGLCYNSLNEAEVKILASSDVSWVYNWGTNPSAAEDALFEKYGIDFIPMQWGLTTEKSLASLRTYYENHPECKYLLGYNEPNLGAGVGGSGITPADAAKDWEKLEAIAQEFNLELVGPALQYSGEKLGDGKIYSTPRLWMDSFIEDYKKLHGGKEPRYDYFCLHCYMNWPSAQEGYLKEYYDGKSAYKKKIWLTEFCAWEYNNGGQNESISAQTSSMAEKVKFMDGYDGVDKYAWFMSAQHTSDIPFNSLFTQVNSDGSLTTLGQSYLNLGYDKLLAAALDEAKEMLEGAVAGDNPGDYKAEAISAFRASYEEAMAQKDSSKENELKSAYKALTDAKKTFGEEKIKAFKRSREALSESDFTTSLTKNLGKEAFDSSSGEGFLAFDKDLTTRWESAFEDNQWLSVDFGEEVSFNTLRFKWEAAYSSAFSIEISENGIDWTSILDVDDCGGGDETYSLTVTQKTRHLRFFGKTRSTAYGHSFYEWGISEE